MPNLIALKVGLNFSTRIFFIVLHEVIVQLQLLVVVRVVKDVVKVPDDVTWMLDGRDHVETALDVIFWDKTPGHE